MWEMQHEVEGKLGKMQMARSTLAQPQEACVGAKNKEAKYWKKEAELAKGKIADLKEAKAQMRPYEGPTRTT